MVTPQFRHRMGEPMVYERQTAEERIARRKRRWTPTTLHFALTPAADRRDS